MGSDTPHAGMPPVATKDGERLSSWKEIASYLKREVRTVQRWEREEGLPVRRLQHKKQGTVYAYKTELDSWTALHTTSQPANGTAESAAWRAVRWWVVGVALAAFFAVAYFSWRPVAAPPPRIMLAVLPFENLGNNSDDYFADGVTDEMITRLAVLQPKRLGVIARTSVMRYKGKEKPVIEMGKELGVEYVLEGSVRRYKDHVRITAQLIDVATQADVWANIYDRDWADILIVQEEVAQQVARAVRVTLTNGKESHPIRARRIDPKAYDAYLHGRFDFNGWSREGFQASIGHFKEAVRRDPNYALANAWLAHSYTALEFFGYALPKQVSPLAKSAAMKAVKIDPTEPEAHLSLALIYQYQEWDWDAARREFERSLQLNPNSPMAHWGYAWFLMSMGNKEGALAEIQRALELDPFSPFINASFGDMLMFARRYQDALTQYENTLQRAPSVAWTYELIGRAYAQQGRYQEAIEAYQRYRTLQAASAGENSRSVEGPGPVNGETYWKAVLQGLREEERQSGIPPAMGFARTYVGLGDKDAAFTWLEKAYTQRSGALVHLRANPAWDPLREDPRFAELVRKVGLPP